MNIFLKIISVILIIIGVIGVLFGGLFFTALGIYGLISNGADTTFFDVFWAICLIGLRGILTAVISCAVFMGGAFCWTMSEK
tara:strand:+ start:1249 stop:1494 length:246 start_codon:yes stop_codon:yes gene_type:complete